MKLEGYTTGGFQRGAPAWKEALWLAVKCVFFLNSLPWPSALRVALLRAFGARIGCGVVVRANVNVTFPWRLEIGDHAWLGEEVLVLSLATVRIGSHVCVSQRAFLCTGSHRFEASGFDLVTKPVTIYDRSWIAAQAFIAPGVEIGPDSMVAAGSVVTATVPPRSLAQGNPATVVREFGKESGIRSQESETENRLSQRRNSDSLTPDSLTPDSLTPDSLTPDSLTPDSLTPDS